MPRQPLEYLNRRAEQERSAAANATDICAKAIHETLAREYEEQARQAADDRPSSDAAPASAIMA